MSPANIMTLMIIIVMLITVWAAIAETSYEISQYFTIFHVPLKGTWESLFNMNDVQSWGTR